MKKKNVLFLGITALIIPALLWILEAKFGLSCRYVNENGHTTKYCGIITLSIFPVILLLPFSATLYFLRDEVFHAWWSFARWWVPVIIGVTLYFEGIGRGGDMIGVIAGGFIIMIISTFYYIFIAISLVKIAQTYFKLRWQEENASEAKLKKLDRVVSWLYGIIIIPAALFLLWLFS